ncbi:hypothetical protein KBD61_04395 [Patescibacteria group bacterium]|nr:hypothetical protein [Patescibacteria group bacterium]MBP9710234.1 hypothetical protein [Patescibacteria group bacterium]
MERPSISTRGIALTGTSSYPNRPGSGECSSCRTMLMASIGSGSSTVK